MLEKIVWTDNSNIQIYDLTTKKETAVKSFVSSHPVISGNKLVWLDESSRVSRLTVYDIKTESRSYITKDVDNSSIPAIYNSRIVWSSTFSYYIRDISTSTQTRVANGNDSDSAGDTPHIYVYDLTTKKH